MPENWFPPGTQNSAATPGNSASGPQHIAPGPPDHPRDEVFNKADFPETPLLLRLVLAASLTGIAIGLVGTLFLVSIRWANSQRILIIDWFQVNAPYWGIPAVMALTAIFVLTAGILVRIFCPQARDNALPSIQSIHSIDSRPDPLAFIPVKFIGAWLVIAAGLVLGQGSPIILMGASFGRYSAMLLGKTRNCWGMLMAAGAGAGFATAFNAPVAGIIFVVEEVFQQVRKLSFLLTAVAISFAIWIEYIILDQPYFYATKFDWHPELNNLPWFVLLGVICGSSGALYNKLVFDIKYWSLKFDSLKIWWIKALAISCVIGALSWFFPFATGNGSYILGMTIQTQLSLPLWMLVLTILLRFVAGPLSYATNNPGGLLGPIEALGSLFGTLVFTLSTYPIPESSLTMSSLAVAGMSGFFASVIRAPITGIILAIELTNSFSMLLPMIIVCAIAEIIMYTLKITPLYASPVAMPDDSGNGSSRS